MIVATHECWHRLSQERIKGVRWLIITRTLPRNGMQLNGVVMLRASLRPEKVFAVLCHEAGHACWNLCRLEICASFSEAIEGLPPISCYAREEGKSGRYSNSVRDLGIYMEEITKNNYMRGEGIRKGMELFEDIMEFTGGNSGHRALQITRSLAQKARWHYAGETYAELMRTTCGEHRDGDAGEDIVKRYREAARLVRA